MSHSGQRTMDALYRDLCLFDEHTWGSSLSVAQPYSLDTQGQFAEKRILAYQPMARAEWLLAQRYRSTLAEAGEGLFVANPAAAPFRGWVRLTASALRADYRSVEDPETGQRMQLHFEPGIQPWGRPRTPEDLSREDISATFPDRAPNRVARFWVERLDQLSGTCRDYFAIDGWADYATPGGRRLWVSRDAPLVTFGSGATLARRETLPEDADRLLAMLFNNFWYTNFVADEHGIMGFQFDILQCPDVDTPAESLAEVLVSEPLLAINPALPEDPHLIWHLHQP